jgi:hypothetical protein
VAERCLAGQRSGAAQGGRHPADLGHFRPAGQLCPVRYWRQSRHPP